MKAKAKAKTPKPKKRINTKEKGDRSQRKTVEYLEALGYVVDTTRRSSYKGSNDFFNLFDHVAVCASDKAEHWNNDNSDFDDIAKECSSGYVLRQGETLFVQTTSNRNKPKKVREAIAAFPATYKLILIWYDRNPVPREVWL